MIIAAFTSRTTPGLHVEITDLGAIAQPYRYRVTRYSAAGIGFAQMIVRGDEATARAAANQVWCSGVIAYKEHQAASAPGITATGRTWSADQGVRKFADVEDVVESLMQTTPAEVNSRPALEFPEGVELSATEDAPKAPAAYDPEESPFPAGRYALVRHGVVKFYKVDRPTEGRWAGYVFVKGLAGDEEHAIRNRTEKAAILSEIGADVREASIRYGREIGSCGVCGRTLTDPESRAAGIGPVCAGKQGW